MLKTPQDRGGPEPCIIEERRPVGDGLAFRTPSAFVVSFWKSPPKRKTPNAAAAVGLHGLQLAHALWVRRRGPLTSWMTKS